MKINTYIIVKNSAVALAIGLFFSCKNSTKQVRNFLAEKNLPISVAKKVYHVYKDSGVITSKLYTPLLNDFRNRDEHPYHEFPEGIKIINFENNGKDSVTIIGDYALSYTKTAISEIKDNVVIINHTEDSKLETDQLFWDQNTQYFFSEKKFILVKNKDTTRGYGFESKENLSKWISKNITGAFDLKENEL
ncbi:MAG: LPS export ABC transporter periplasmic protein LptC [Flavobacteriaceae bacterium]|nr:MAG: LPS export ABC transporter periplasmic protein LptC [Flavobacteriaceae bacterium]